MARLALLAVCLLTALAHAQVEREEDPEGIDLSSTRTGPAGSSYTYGGLLQPGSRALIAQLGWPGFTFSYRQGSAQMDWGGAFTFNYSPYGVTRFIVPQIKLAGHLKFLVSQQQKLAVLVRVAPELQLTFWSSFYRLDLTGLGLSVPLELVMGIDLTSQLRGHVSFHTAPGFSVMAGFTTFAIYTQPVQAGFGFELAATRDLSLHFNSRMGPYFVVGRTGATWFALDLQVGLTYRL